MKDRSAVRASLSFDQVPVWVERKGSQGNGWCFFVVDVGSRVQVRKGDLRSATVRIVQLHRESGCGVFLKGQFKLRVRVMFAGIKS